MQFTFTGKPVLRRTLDAKKPVWQSRSNFILSLVISALKRLKK